MMTPADRSLRRVVLAVVSAFVALLSLQSVAHAEAPMCDETGATVFVPGPFVPAPLAEDGEIRQGEPCKAEPTFQRLEPGAPHDQRVLTTVFEEPPDATPCIDSIGIVASRATCVGPPRVDDFPPTDARVARVYRPPR